MSSKRGAVAAAAAPAPLPPAVPLRGSLYAQLLTADDLKVKLRLSQKLWLNKSTAVKLFGMFSNGEPPRLRAQVKHKTFVNALDTRVSGRVRYEAAQQTVKSTIYAKRAVRLGPNTALNAKLELHARHKLAEEGKFAVTGGERDVQARLEMSHKVLNITDSQDCRLRIGLDLKTRSGYLEIRENHASLKIHSGGWSVLYDL